MNCKQRVGYLRNFLGSRSGTGATRLDEAYCRATVGEMTEEIIKSFLEHHFEPSSNDDFKTEP
jgi:hypothetical protein